MALTRVSGRVVYPHGEDTPTPVTGDGVIEYVHATPGVIGEAVHGPDRHRIEYTDGVAGEAWLKAGMWRAYVYPSEGRSYTLHLGIPEDGDVTLADVVGEVVPDGIVTKGDPGEPGAPGAPGRDGQDGQDGHTPEITFDGTTIVVDGTPGPDLKGEPGEGGGGIAGMVPIFATLAEAQAWEAENPGKVALTLEEPATPDIEVSAPAPVFNDDANTYTIPTATGVRYLVDGAVVVGTVEVGDVDVSVTVTAEALDGYVLTGASEWTHEFTATPASPALAPEDVGSLLASWDMDEASATGGTITGVPDSVGGRTLVPATTAPPLISAGGHQWAAFSASSAQRLRWVGPFPAPLPEHTLCIILRPGATSGTVASSAYTSAEVTGTGLGGRNEAVWSHVLGGSTEAVLLTVAVTGTQVTTRVGGVTQVGTGATKALTSNFSLGATYGSSGAGFTSATVGRAWIHSKAITDAEHLALTEWARAEWGTL